MAEEKPAINVAEALAALGIDTSGLSEEDTQNLVLELINKTQHYTPKNLKAKKAQTKKMFESEHIFLEDGETEVSTESTKKKEELIELNASAEAKRILKGKIIGCISLNPDNPSSPLCAEIRFGTGQWDVRIPSFVLFDYKSYKYTDAGTQEKVKIRINDMIGAEVKFVVRHIDQKTGLVIGDRLQAMDQEAYANYIHKQRDGKTRFVKDVIVQARVVRVSKNAITVYAQGADCVLRRDVAREENELSWTFIPDCRDVFKTNDLVNVRILDFEVEENVEKFNNNYTLVRGAVSIKRTTKDPMSKYFDKIEAGNRYCGTVTYIPTDSKGMFVKLYDEVDCMVAYPKRGELPYVGQDVVIEITEKIEEKDGRKKLFGILVR